MAYYQRVVHKQLGELLIERKIINSKQLEKALAIQKEKGGLLGEVLVELGFAKEEDIALAITTQYGFPYLPLANYSIEDEIIKVIPERVARQYCLIPVDRIGNNLSVAMSNPLNTQAIEDLELLSGCNIQTFVGITSDIKKAIDRYYK